MTNFKRTAAWLTACEKEPNGDNLSLQIGCHIEEFCEFLSTLGTHKYTNLDLVTSDLEIIAKQLKTGENTAFIPQHLRVDALDALCDCEVTGNGVAFLAGFDKDAADQEVMASNESKLVGGKAVFLPGGKIGKGPNYKRPQLEEFV